MFAWHTCATAADGRSVPLLPYELCKQVLIYEGFVAFIAEHLKHAAASHLMLNAQACLHCCTGCCTGCRADRQDLATPGKYAMKDYLRCTTGTNSRALTTALQAVKRNPVSLVCTHVSVKYPAFMQCS